MLAILCCNVVISALASMYKGPGKVSDFEVLTSVTNQMSLKSKYGLCLQNIFA